MHITVICLKQTKNHHCWDEKVKKSNKESNWLPKAQMLESLATRSSSQGELIHRDSNTINYNKSKYNTEGERNLHPKICFFGLRIILGWLFLRKTRHWRSSKNQVEVTLLKEISTCIKEISMFSRVPPLL